MSDFEFPPTLDFFHLKIKEREFQKSYLFLFVYTSPFHIRVDYHRWNRLPAIQNAPYKNFSFYEKLWKPLESFRYFSFHQPWLFCFFVVADPSWIHWISKQTKYKKRAYFNVILKINLDILIDLSKKYEYKMNDIDNKEVVEKNILKSKCFCGIGLNSICFLQIELIFSSKQQQSQKWMFHFI